MSAVKAYWQIEFIKEETKVVNLAFEIMLVTFPKAFRILFLKGHSCSFLGRTWSHVI